MQESLNQFLRDLRTQIEIEFDLRGIDLAFSDADLLHDLQYGRDD